jgi:hypothetical protein
MRTRGELVLPAPTLPHLRRRGLNEGIHRCNFVCLGFQNFFFGYFLGRYFLGACFLRGYFLRCYLFGPWRRLDFLKFGKIGKRIETEEFKKGFGGPIDDGASG